jgi:hypothetical protein
MGDIRMGAESLAELVEEVRKAAASMEAGDTRRTPALIVSPKPSTRSWFD